MKKLTLMLLSLLIAGVQLLQAQGVSITGKTVDGTTGESLPGVTVQVKGTTVGAISQADGTYRIANVPEGSTTLVFSFIGYETQEVEIAGRSVVDVTLQESVTALEEVVVTGYSVERKKDIIGSVAVVNTEEMLSTPSGNVTAQLAGRVAGVNISSDGSLTGTSKVRVRGFGSFASSEPLYIIDGVPSVSTYDENTAQTYSALDRLNPNDIESIQFLKDAASASVYGSRAASGVVIITTKQGKEGPVKVNVDAYYGVNYVSKNNFPDLLNTEEYGELLWESMRGAGLSPGDEDWDHPQYGNGDTPVIPEYILAIDDISDPSNPVNLGGADLEALKLSDPTLFSQVVDVANYDYETHPIYKAADTDWFDEVYNPSPVTNIQLSATGGSERGTFAMSANYYHNEKTSDEYSYFTRYTVRANSTFNIKNFLRIGENLQVSYSEGRDVGYPASAWTMMSILPVWDEGGNPTGGKAQGISKTNDGGNGNSPIGQAWHNRFDKYYTYGIFGNLFAEATILKNFVVRSSFGLDFDYNQYRNLTQTTYENAESNGVADVLYWRTRDHNAWTWSNTLTYSKSFGGHTVKLMLGTEATNDITSYHTTQIDEFIINDDETFLVPSAGTGSRTVAGNYTPFGLFSYFGRLDYSYADKYILNATVRRDGSSKFGANNRWGNFPSVALGWRISGEDFMQTFTWLTDLKLKASLGVVGNQSGLSYDNQFYTYESSTSQNYPITGSNSSVVTSFTAAARGNPDARWERTIQQNYGFDATLFTGSMTVGLDYYIKKTNDLLVTRQNPYTEPSITQPYVNIGDIENKGLDINVSYRSKLLGQIDYEIGANFSTYSNKVTKIAEDPAVTLTGGSTRMGYASITKVNEEIASFYGWELDGFINSETELTDYLASIGNESSNTWLTPRVGGWKLVDQNGDGYVNDDDRVILGSPHPDFQIGFNLSLAWKGLDFSTFIFWNQGNDLFNQSRYNVDFNTYAFNRSARMLYESWTDDNHNAKLPALNSSDATSAKYVTDYFVEDASYVRVKTMQLGYSLPQNILNVIKVDRLRIYVQAQNLITWTKFTGLDPGLSLSGTSDLSMGVVNNYDPTPKQIIFGINMGF